MSQINNRITTTYTASAGQAIAVQNQLAGGITNLSRAIYQQTGMSERMNAQWRAFGTTIRYALAGSVIFGATRLVTVLRDTQRQYALIGSIAGGAFDEQIVGAQKADQALATLYGNAQKGSLEAITPVNDFNEALVNLYSTVQNLDADKAVQLTTILSQGAQLATVPVDDLTRSITGMNQAFGRSQNMRNIGQGVRGFRELIAQAPGGPAYGGQFIQQLAPLAAVSRLAAITPQEMYGLFLTESRIGATPATGGRGLQYLLQSIAVPTSPKHAAALRKAGITPQSVQDNGGVWAIKQLIKHTESLGVRGDMNKAINTPDDALDLLDTADPGTQARGLGVSGRGIEFLSSAIGRIHGVRALIALMAQERANKQMTSDQQVIADAMANTEEAQKRFADKWDQFAREQPLQAAAVSVDVIRRNIITAYEPLMNLAGRGISRVGAYSVAHPRRTQEAALAAGGLFAAYGLAKGIGLGGFLRGGGGILTRGTAIQAAVTQGGAGPGMSPQHPLYVMVVGQLFNGRGGTPVIAPGPGGAAGDAAKGGGMGRLARLASRLGAPAGAIAGASRFGAGTAGLAVADALIAAALVKDKEFQEDMKGTWYGRGISWVGKHHGKGLMSMMNGGDSTNDKTQMLVNSWLRSVGAGGAAKPLAVLKGEAQVSVDVNLTHPDGTKTTKRVHVPVDLWSGGRAPSNRGKKGATRRGGT